LQWTIFSIELCEPLCFLVCSGIIVELVLLINIQILLLLLLLIVNEVVCAIHIKPVPKIVLIIKVIIIKVGVIGGSNIRLIILVVLLECGRMVQLLELVLMLRIELLARNKWVLLLLGASLVQSGSIVTWPQHFPDNF